MDLNTELQLKEGQNVRVIQKVIEGKRERNVPFVGVILSVKGAGSNQMITVRQQLEGVGVDRIFPVMSPTLVKIELVEEKKGKKAKKSSKNKTRKSK